MCEVLDRHNYSADAEAEVEAVVNGHAGESVDSLLDQLRRWRWVLIPLLVWIARVEYRIGPGGFSNADAMEMREEFHRRIEQLPPEKWVLLQNERYDTLTHGLERIEAAVRANGAAILRHLESHE